MLRIKSVAKKSYLIMNNGGQAPSGFFRNLSGDAAEFSTILTSGKGLGTVTGRVLVTTREISRIIPAECCSFLLSACFQGFRCY